MYDQKTSVAIPEDHDTGNPLYRILHGPMFSAENCVAREVQQLMHNGQALADHMCSLWHYGYCMLLYGTSTVTRRSRLSMLVCQIFPTANTQIASEEPSQASRPLHHIRADESILGSLTSSPNVGPFKWPPSPAPSFTPVGTACHSTKKHKET